MAARLFVAESVFAGLGVGEAVAAAPDCAIAGIDRRTSTQSGSSICLRLSNIFDSLVWIQTSGRVLKRKRPAFDAQNPRLGRPPDWQFVYAPGRDLVPNGPRLETSEALSKQVGHLDEEGTAVTAKSGSKLTSKGVRTVVIHVIVVPNIKRSPWAGRPSEQQLAAHPRV